MANASEGGWGAAPRQDDGFLPRLSPPPRHVPLSWRVRLLFGGLGVFAWLWLAFGGAMSSVFLAEADLTSWWRFRGDLVRVEGVVVGCEDTNARANRRDIHGVRYRFGGEEQASPELEARVEDPTGQEGVSYAAEPCPDLGATVRVEHVPGHPELSRIEGMDRSTFGPGVALVAIFPFIGIVLVLGAFVHGARRIRLLRDGRLALGTLVSQEPTNVRVNNRPVVRLTFALQTERGPVQVALTSSTPEALVDDPREKIFYDPERPGRAVAWDDLPHRPRTDGTGQLEPLPLGGTLAVLVPPAIAVAALTLVYVLRS